MSKVNYIYCEKMERTWLDAGMPSFYCVYLQILVAKYVNMWSQIVWFVKPDVWTLTPAFVG